MNLSLFRTLAFLSALALLVPLSGCPEVPPGASVPDDDDAGDDDDLVDDDDALSPYVTFTGRVFATARDTGQSLSEDDYLSCAGKTVLYVLTDPADLSAPAAKFTMDSPTSWELTVDRDSGPYHLVGLTDDGNRIIGVEDVRRTHPYNPVYADRDREALNVIMDLPCLVGGGASGGAGGSWGGGGNGGGPGGGGGGGDDDDVDTTTMFTGVVNLVDLDDGEIMIAANNEDGTVGPIEYKFYEQAGPFEIEVANNRAATVLLAFHDTDGNGLFEVSDSIGYPSGNPYQLGLGDVSGLSIDVPTADPVPIPQPPVYVGVQGTVAMANYTTGIIRVYASAGSSDGVVFSAAVLPAPGAFALAAPIDAGDVMVWAVLDSAADGSWDLATDPNDAFGPVEVPPTGLQGVSLDLGGVVPNSISGSISYGGTIDPADILFVGLYQSASFTGDPDMVQRYIDLEFPVSFQMLGVPDGTWYVGALLDIGGDNPEGPGIEDLWTVFGGGGVSVNGGQSVGGINFGF